ncbi:hypothetical protein [uncultured Clostridium sp.]|uniref:hypothetical protein n=1 Tax=uncultured Clostridium sp. TaxID=59620 RepID=UPI0028EC535A|nr:hypothetical protein [uncultured Clostridium sp.]
MKKGFSTIEVIVYISVFTMIFVLTGKNLTLQLYNYRKNMNYKQEELYVDQAFIYIEEKLKEGDHVEILKNKSDSEIKIVTKGVSDYIKYNRGKIIISYGKSNYGPTNNIMLNVKNFLVEDIENTVYINIITMSGKEYERCFGVKKEKDL